MCIFNIKLHDEGFAVGMSDGHGKEWAEYYLPMQASQPLAVVLVWVMQNFEPIRGDKETLREWEEELTKKQGKKKKGKKGKK